MDDSDFVELAVAVPDAMMDIRYYSTYNFVGERIDGYLEPVALVTKETAEALREVSDDLVEEGYRLFVFDAYRPQTAVDHFVRWAQDLDDVEMKPSSTPTRTSPRCSRRATSPRSPATAGVPPWT